jgi:hypothetical protein
LEINTLSDPARFAQAVRGVARDAHQMLTHSPSAAALRGLSRRIDVLSAVLGDRREGPLGTWLDNLGREVRSAAVLRAGGIPSHVPLCVSKSLAPADEWLALTEPGSEGT